jgi:hypothetical protein
MGALIYEAEVAHSLNIPYDSLGKIAEEITEFQEHDNDEYVEDLLNLGGSASGARPKVLLSLENQHWLIKFPSHIDPKDIGSIEYAYYLMAQCAGLDVDDSAGRKPISVTELMKVSAGSPEIGAITKQSELFGVVKAICTVTGKNYKESLSELAQGVFIKNFKGALSKTAGNGFSFDMDINGGTNRDKVIFHPFISNKAIFSGMDETSVKELLGVSEYTQDQVKGFADMGLNVTGVKSAPGPPAEATPGADGAPIYVAPADKADAQPLYALTVEDIREDQSDVVRGRGTNAAVIVSGKDGTNYLVPLERSATHAAAEGLSGKQSTDNEKLWKEIKDVVRELGGYFR